jgi:NOL1/NOP2/sun family putative RNA methylase
MPSTTPEIPPLFLERMSRLLGNEYPAFAEALKAAPRSGLRVNTLKLMPEQFKEIAPFTLGEKIAWCESAFHLTPSALSPGQHPYHQAGLYYLQDPSAMSPAELLSPKPGERVLDLAAAPGGKTTHLAALMQGRGLLVANEIKDKRVGHLAQNVERWGAGNVVITNETPERLADHFGPTFDRVLVDAPCSGEGMFRKDMGARVDWSPEMVAGCAVRQRNILQVAAKLVRPGGFLLYSTCTFAPEEDEAVVNGLAVNGLHHGRVPDRVFTDRNGLGGFEVVALRQFPGFMPGRPDWVDADVVATGLSGAVRLFPHRVEGEGHFVCLLQRTSDAGADREQKRMPGEQSRRKTVEADLRFWREFAQDVLLVNLAEARLRVVGERLYFIPEESLDFGRLRVVHPGVWLGTFKKGRFEPAHPLALFLKPGEAKNTLDLPVDGREIAAYLRGESLAADVQGWTLVTVSGFGIGWGKGVQGTLKNHYPRGWM